MVKEVLFVLGVGKRRANAVVVTLPWVRRRSIMGVCEVVSAAASFPVETGLSG